MRFSLPDDFQGSTFLKTEGTYHVVVSEMDEQPTMGERPVDGFKVNVGVLDGTHDGCKGKTIKLLFETPNGSHSEGLQKLLFNRQVQFLRAVGLIREGMEGQDVDIDLQQAVHRQFVVQLVHDKSGKYLQIDGTSIYHVDDPDVSAIPKSKDHLGMIPAELRRVKAAPAKSGSTKTASAKVKTEAEAVKAAARAQQATATIAADEDDL